MKSQKATTAEFDRQAQQRPEAVQKPPKGAAEASDKVVYPFAQQTLRPQ